MDHHNPCRTQESNLSTLNTFNSALSAGILNPMFPPPHKPRSSPTLFEIMSTDSQPHSQSSPKSPIPDPQSLILNRISSRLANQSPDSQFNDPSSSDVRLTLTSIDGVRVSIDVHRRILVRHSEFFRVRVSDSWSQEQRCLPHLVDIEDCEDVEVYIEALRLMYCANMKRRLSMHDVPRVLGILKVSAAIGFEAGVLCCLEYLEAAPWSEDEEEKVHLLLSELRLEGVGACDVLKRLSIEVPDGTETGISENEILPKLLSVVFQGKDERARREMKGLVSKMLRENTCHNDMRKESLYLSCEECLESLRRDFLCSALSERSDTRNASRISREAENLRWVLDILIDGKIAEDFLNTWGSQTEMSNAHSKVAAIYRYEISRVTARLLVGIGKGQLLASKDARCRLLETWLVPFYDDFGWMKRASKGFDCHLAEDGLSNTILTLPMAWQRDLFLAWFDRFLNSSDDCPNIRRGFEAWWRRTFWWRKGEPQKPQNLRVGT